MHHYQWVREPMLKKLCCFCLHVNEGTAILLQPHENIRFVSIEIDVTNALIFSYLHAFHHLILRTAQIHDLYLAIDVSKQKERVS